MRKPIRANTTPASVSARLTIGESVQIYAQNKRTDRINRQMIQDMCDFCFAVAWMRRSQLPTRRYGKRFSCNECYERMKQTNSLPIPAPLPCWKKYGDWRFMKNDKLSYV